MVAAYAEDIHAALTSIEPRTQIWEISSPEESKFQKRSLNQKFDFSEGHNFLCQRNAGVVAYGKKHTTTRYLD